MSHYLPYQSITADIAYTFRSHSTIPMCFYLQYDHEFWRLHRRMCTSMQSMKSGVQNFHLYVSNQSNLCLQCIQWHTTTSSQVLVTSTKSVGPQTDRRIFYENEVLRYSKYVVTRAQKNIKLFHTKMKSVGTPKTMHRSTKEDSTPKTMSHRRPLFDAFALCRLCVH